ncbi:MAG: adenylate/guanylate cyclase domain-containing protein [Chloroflexota bacterium]
MPSDLPEGTVTFLFTDIEGSTALLKELGTDAYAAALAGHRRLVREAFAAAGGVEVDTQGDALFYAFPTAAGAVAGAAQAQEALNAGSIRVRMGLHTGEAHRGEEGYVGEDVHLGARIAAAGHGGQVLISGPTRALVEAQVTDLGEHRLKDFDEPIWIYQLGSDRFPPLKTISNTNLPRPASSFIGREREVGEVVERLRDGARLLTLTGPGGSGKTRLAIEAATTLVPEFRNGTFWIGLAPVRDPALVPETIGQVIGAKDGLAEHIGQRQMLLLVDNLEQVIHAAPGLADLVEACPNLAVLVTSRERLRVRGEVEYPVAPLADPEAVELFTTRAQVEADDSARQLCRALDNLPLAIELAAARVSVLTPAQILDRLSQRLDLLKGGRDADPRQQTLRATIEWSYELLTAQEQALFARLAVFAGGCTLEAAEPVVDAHLDTLQSLVDRSLVRRTGERFWMLETIREYAAERLEALGEANDIRRRHADFFLALAEEADPHLRGADPKAWLARLGPESDNFRAALDHLVAWADGEKAQRLSGTLDAFWCPRTEFAEGRRYLEAGLRLDERPTQGRAKALVAAAHLARDDSDPEAGRQLGEEGLALYEALGDPWGTGQATLWLGACVADEGDFERARDLFEAAAHRSSEAGDHENALFANRLLAWMYYELGDRSRARTLHEANLVRARELGSRDLEGSILGALSEYAVDDGRLADAVPLAAAGVRLRLEDENQQGIAIELCKAANTLLHVGDAETAVQLVASSLAWHEEVGARPLPYLDELIHRTLTSGREQLGEEDYARAWEAGRRLTVEKAAAVALGRLARAEVSREPSGGEGR